MHSEVWKQREVAMAFVHERSRLLPDRKRQMEVMLRLLRSAPKSPRRVLDLGSSDAILLAATLDAFPEATGIALDYSPPMLEQASERLEPYGPRATAAESDLSSPLWRQQVEGSFDAVISGYAIHHLTHDRKRQLYEEIFSLLTDGGSFLNCEHVASPSPRVENLFNEAMSDYLLERRRDRGEDVAPDQVYRDYVSRPDRAANILAPVEEQCHWLREIGFRDVDCFWKYFELAIFGGIR